MSAIYKKRKNINGKTPRKRCTRPLIGCLSHTQDSLWNLSAEPIGEECSCFHLLQMHLRNKEIPVSFMLLEQRRFGTEKKGENNASKESLGHGDLPVIIGAESCKSDA